MAAETEASKTFGSLFDDEGPRCWPVCAVCAVPYAYKWCMTPTDPDRSSAWLWVRDCKHKGKPVLRDREGECPTE